MALFGKPKAPLGDELRSWIDRSAEWILGEFGVEATRQRPVVLPEARFFPDRYDGTEATLEPLVRRVCGYMDIDRNRFRLEVFADDDTRLLQALPVYESAHQGAAGLYFDAERDGKLVLALEEARLGDPLSVVATTAHELCHVHLLADRRVDRDREDHEPLTDLLTVFLGLGVFTANAAFRFKQWEDGARQGWQASAAGYLPEEAFGYSLALFALVRGETKPAWSSHLAPNVAHYFKHSMRFLRHEPPPWLADLQRTSG